MKTYEEMAKSVIDRKNEYEKEKAIKRKRYIKVMTPVATLSLAVIIGVGVSIAREPKEIISEPILDPTPPTKTETGYTEEAVNGGADKNASGSIAFVDPDENGADFNCESPMKRVLSGYGDENQKAEDSMKIPDAGEVFLEQYLKDAIGEFGERYTYRVVVFIAKDGVVLTSESDEFTSEAERLSSLGYIVALETVTFATGESETYFTLHATDGQLRNFNAREDLGYTVYLYDSVFTSAETDDAPAVNGGIEN